MAKNYGFSRRHIIYKRRTRVLDTRKKYLIITEGATEKGYFNEFNCYPVLLIKAIDKQDNKRSLVEKAVLERKNQEDHHLFYPDTDEAWVVFDRDADPKNKTDKDNFNQALLLAKHNNLNVAYSNDAIELWFLLHFQEVGSEMHRTQLNSLLSKQLKRKYHKAEGREIYHLTKNTRADAIKRAKALENTHKHIPACDANPTTTVHILVERIVSEDGFRER